MTYIYALVDLKLGIVGYVGQSVVPSVRLDWHIDGGQAVLSLGGYSWPITTNRDNWIAYLLTQGRKPEMWLLECVTDRDADQRERFWIAEITSWGQPLTNAQIPLGMMLERGIKPHNAYKHCPYPVNEAERQAQKSKLQQAAGVIDVPYKGRGGE
jgi:hypothetical protein